MDKLVPNELSNKDLENVAGGHRAYGTALKSHGAYIPSSEAEEYEKQNVYVVSDFDETKWALGKLVNVGGSKYFLGILYALEVKETPNNEEINFGGANFTVGKIVDVFAEGVTLFLEK